MSTTKMGRMVKCLEACENKHERLNGRNSKNEVGRAEAIEKMRAKFKAKTGKTKFTKPSEDSPASSKKGYKKGKKGK